MSDLIDREALLRQIDIDSEGEPGYYGDTWKFIDTIKSMPPASCSEFPNNSDTISRQAAIDAIEAEKIKHGNYLTSSYVGYEMAEKVVEQLPPIQPRRGKWMPVTNGRGGHECDQCHEYAPSYQSGEEHLSDFCPHCGAKMEVTE